MYIVTANSIELIDGNNIECLKIIDMYDSKRIDWRLANGKTDIDELLEIKKELKANHSK